MSTDGAADQPLPAKADTELSKWTKWGAVLVFVALVGGCSVWISSNSKPSQADVDHDVKRVCQGFVEDRLKSPASAEFSGLTVTHVGEDYTVDGTVDSQNGFGAMIRNTFTCEVASSGDQWRLTSLTGLAN